MALADVFATTEDTDIQEIAADVLIEVGDMSSIPVLDKATRDKDEYTRLAASRIKIHYYAAALPTGLIDPRAKDKYHHEREELAEALVAGDTIGAATEVADCVYYATKAHYNRLITDRERDRFIEEAASSFGCTVEIAHDLCVAKFALRAQPGNPKDDSAERAAVARVLE